MWEIYKYHPSTLFLFHYKDTIGELTTVSQPTISRIIKRVASAIASLKPRFIRFPQDRQCSREKQKFMEIGGIPGVLGAIDCTHVKIRSPGTSGTKTFFICL